MCLVYLKNMLYMQVCMLICRWVFTNVYGVHVCVHVDVLRYRSVHVCACLWALVYSDP